MILVENTVLLLKDIIQSVCLWMSIIILPFIMTLKLPILDDSIQRNESMYKLVFPTSWYDEVPVNYFDSRDFPPILGLVLGLSAVIIGQIFVLAYFCILKIFFNKHLIKIQQLETRNYDISEGVTTHLSQPEGFLLLGGYLICYWIFGLMPSSYYSFYSGINWTQVLLQLLTQDFIQYCMHLVEHKLDSRLYRLSHKPHHRFTNPRLFDAFNGSITDTVLMILVPLFLTSRVVHVNVWTYMTFGTIYANWLTLIHSEFSHPWDLLFRFIGFGTAADHHIHHKFFKFNYGHLFMYWDILFGTYMNPKKVAVFNKDI